MSWLLSLERDSEIEVGADASIVSMADVGINWTTKLSTGAIEFMQPRDGGGQGVPIFFKLARLRRNGKFALLTGRGVAPSPSYVSDEPLYELVSPSMVLGDEAD